MRGDDRQLAGMWSYMSPEQRVPADHPLRPIRVMVDRIPAEMSPDFKTVGLLRTTRHRGRARVNWLFIFGLAVYNLVRIRNLAAATG